LRPNEVDVSISKQLLAALHFSLEHTAIKQGGGPMDDYKTECSDSFGPEYTSYQQLPN
jgi:hypothetical protein